MGETTVDRSVGDGHESGLVPGSVADRRQVEEGIRSRLGEIGCSDPEIDAELFTQILDSFVGRTPEELQLLLDAVGGGDAGEATRRAHSIRGAASAVGASALAAACLAVEAAVGTPEGVPPVLCERLRDTFDVTLQAMGDLVSSFDPAGAAGPDQAG